MLMSEPGLIWVVSLRDHQAVCVERRGRGKTSMTVLIDRLINSGKKNMHCAIFGQATCMKML